MNKNYKIIISFLFIIFSLSYINADDYLSNKYQDYLLFSMTENLSESEKISFLHDIL